MFKIKGKILFILALKKYLLLWFWKRKHASHKISYSYFILFYFKYKNSLGIFFLEKKKNKKKNRTLVYFNTLWGPMRFFTEHKAEEFFEGWRCQGALSVFIEYFCCLFDMEIWLFFQIITYLHLSLYFHYPKTVQRLIGLSSGLLIILLGPVTFDHSTQI